MLKPIKMMLLELTAWGRFWLFLGLAVLMAAAAMSFDFGYQVSLKHAVFLGLLTVFTAFAPETAYRMWKTNRKWEACTIMVLAVPFFGIEFYSHAGYTAGLRGTNVASAHVQQARYNTIQADEADNAENLQFWKENLRKLQELEPWAATVKADGLRAALATAEEAVRQEAARGGCGPRCLAKMAKVEEISKKIATAEKMADLTKRIEATQRILDKKREASVAAVYVPSAVEEQNTFLAKNAALIMTGSIDASPVLTEGVNQTVNLAMALAGTTLPAFALFLAGLYRVREIEEELAALPGTHTPAPHREPIPVRTMTQIKVPQEQKQKIGETTDLTAGGLTLNVPLTVNHTSNVEGSDALVHARKIGKVRDTAFARRVEQATRSYRNA